MSAKIYAWYQGMLISLRNQKGQGMVEYGLILALVAVVAIAALTTVGKNLGTMLNNVGANL
ncbi:MAG: Flp/Fap pilin component, partial [Firmicutes bacterium]|nr:Flp/Fap pilin component [Bacillota bacterium]